MNITGWLKTKPVYDNDKGRIFQNGYGVFSGEWLNDEQLGSLSWNTNNGGYWKTTFDASRSWTGEKIKILKNVKIFM